MNKSHLVVLEFNSLGAGYLQVQSFLKTSPAEIIFAQPKAPGRYLFVALCDLANTEYLRDNKLNTDLFADLYSGVVVTQPQKKLLQGLAQIHEEALPQGLIVIEGKNFPALVSIINTLDLNFLIELHAGQGLAGHSFCLMSYSQQNHELLKKADINATNLQFTAIPELTAEFQSYFS